MSDDQGRGLPPGWVSSTFGEITTRGIDQTGPPVHDDTFVYVDISSIDNQAKQIMEPKILPVSKAPTRARQRLIAGDVLVSMTRPNLNAVAILPETMNQAVGTTGFQVLRADGGVEAKWLFYLVQTDDFIREMSEIVQGVVYPAIRPKDVLGYRVPLAPEAEQRRIISEIETHLTRLAAGVSSLERMQHKLKSHRAAVLKAACEGRLVPTEAELARAEGRDYEPANRLLARVAQERRARWEADQLAKMTVQGKTPKGEAWRSKYQEADAPSLLERAELPEGWAWATVEQVTSTAQYGSSQKTNENPKGVPVLRMGNIVDGRLDLDKLKYLPVEHDEFPDLLLDAGDVLFNRTNSAELVGKTAVYRGIPSPCSFASYLIRVRLIDDVKPDLLAYYINSSLGRAWVASVVTQQVGQANVNGTKLQALVIPVPPAAEQARIVAEVERRLSLVDDLEAVVSTNLKRAGRLRQAILKRAFEGKLVPQAPADEPASALLERIKRGRKASPPSFPGM